jgi:MFS family permease
LKGGICVSAENKTTQSENGSEHRWKVLWATFTTYLYDSYDLIILAIAMPVLLKTLNITLPEGGLLGSATMIGAALGGVIFGMIAENYGRRRALIIALVWFGLGNGVVYFIDSWGSWMMLRLLTGIAIGGVWGPCAALIASHWAPKYRGRAASFVFSSFAIGAVIASFVGRMVLNTDWRLLFLLGSSSIVFAILVYMLVPADKPREKGSDGQVEKIGIGAIFEGGYAKTTFLAFLVSFFNLAGYWGAAYWIPTFLTKERGLSLTTMANFSLVMYVGMFIGYQFFGNISDKIGRRTAMIAAFLTMAIGVGIYIVVLNPMFLFWWGIVVGFGLGGVGGVVGAYYSELFPDRIRAYAGGFCFNMGRIGAIIAPFTVGHIGRLYGLQTGLACTVVIFLLGAITLLFLPETLEKKAS